MRHYETADMALTATLLTLGIEMVDIKKDGTKATFYFNSSERLKEIIRNYFNNKLLVNPVTYFGNIKGLKTRIYQDF